MRIRSSVVVTVFDACSSAEKGYDLSKNGGRACCRLRELKARPPPKLLNLAALEDSFPLDILLIPELVIGR